MKRTAAIIGPTPPFLQWTIAVPCPFRDPDAKNLTNAAFRELRSLRAISVGEMENRIIDGVCLHPHVSTDEAADAVGFPVEEVYAAFDGAEKVKRVCQACPANVPISGAELDDGAEISRAGCFGWLPFGERSVDGSADFMRLMECEDSLPSDETSIVTQFESAIGSMEESSPFRKTSPRWYGVWSLKKFNASQLVFLDHVCKKVRCRSIAWRRLAQAIEIAVKFNLAFHVEMTPPGNSDGSSWTTEGCCATCGVAASTVPCQVCGSNAVPLRSRKMKVLGLRPYLKLASIVGQAETARLVEKFRSNREA